jgi:hypothetical protein
MNKEHIVNLISVFSGSENLEDEDLINKLRENGLNMEEAERLIAFFPIAFGRVIINTLGNVDFSDLYRIKENGKEFKLTDEPIYKLAENVALESYETGLVGRELFSAIATRSAELNAVNKALNEDVDLNSAVFKPVLLFGYKSIGKNKEFLSGIFS